MLKRNGSHEMEQREGMRGGKGTVTIQHYFGKGDFGSPHFRVCARLIVPPGASIGLHPHAGEDEAWLIVKGSGRVTDAGVTSEIGDGDAILTGRGEAHGITNTGEGTLEAIAIIVGY